MASKGLAGKETHPVDDLLRSRASGQDTSIFHQDPQYQAEDSGVEGVADQGTPLIFQESWVGLSLNWVDRESRRATA